MPALPLTPTVSEELWCHEDLTGDRRQPASHPQPQPKVSLLLPSAARATAANWTSQLGDELELQRSDKGATGFAGVFHTNSGKFEARTLKGYLEAGKMTYIGSFDTGAPILTFHQNFPSRPTVCCGSHSGGSSPARLHEQTCL
jgi:hypothetical protein